MVDCQSQKSIKVAYILCYRDPNYIRSKSLVRSLKLLPNIVLYEIINEKKGVSRYFEVLARLLQTRFKEKPDVYILGFRGHDIFWPCRFITSGYPLIFDELMSPSDAMINEGKLGAIGVFFGYVAYVIEWIISRLSNQILTDTEIHRSYLSSYFKLSHDKIAAVPVGADENLISCVRNRTLSDGPLKVLFYGTFLPLHGMNIIVEAACLLRGEDIEFTIIGGTGKTLKQFLGRLHTESLANIKHIPWVNFDRLIAEYVGPSDVCLGGPFGGTPQGLRVVTGKTQQFLAMGKPTVVGKIPENGGFIDRVNCLLVDQNDAADLANAIRWANAHRGELSRIGEKGLLLYQKNFSIDVISKRMEAILVSSIQKKAAF